MVAAPGTPTGADSRKVAGEGQGRVELGRVATGAGVGRSVLLGGSVSGTSTSHILSHFLDMIN